MIRLSRLRCLLAVCIVAVLLLAFYGELNYMYIWKTTLRRSVNRSVTVKEEYKPQEVAVKTMVSKCSPIKNILFLKTHKTGSSTISNIFFRYGDSWNLSFILGDDTMVGWPRRFLLSDVLTRNGNQPNFLCSHTRYNKKPMNYLFPKNTSIYLTILRDPVSQFESVFNYVGFGEVFGLGNDPTKSFTAFLRKGIEFKDITKARSSVLARNPMMFDLGLDYKFYQNATAVKKYIAFLEKEFDLVMIMEYFEESMVLMKRLLCWEFDDILHIKSNERLDKERAELSDNLKENIKRWNKADMLLYQHFNKTFWHKIKMEGKGFYDDLATFRQMKEEMTRTCFNGTTVKQVYAGKYVKTLSLNQNLPAETKVKCERMTRVENTYLAYLRKKQSFKSAGVIRHAVLNDKTDISNKVSWDVAQDLRYDPLPV